MSRWRRWLFNVLAAVSLMMCVAALVLWELSYAFHQGITFGWADGPISMVRVFDGNVEVSRVGAWPHPAMLSRFDFTESRQPIPNGIYLFWPAGRMGQFDWRWPRVRGWTGLDIADLRTDAGKTTNRVSSSSPLPVVGWVLVFPAWLLAVMFAVPATCIAASRKRRVLRTRRRIRLGLCLACGYDLRASQDRCPECGTAIPPRAAAEGANA